MVVIRKQYGKGTHPRRAPESRIPLCSASNSAVTGSRNGDSFQHERKCLLEPPCESPFFCFVLPPQRDRTQTSFLCPWRRRSGTPPWPGAGEEQLAAGGARDSNGAGRGIDEISRSTQIFRRAACSFDGCFAWSYGPRSALFRDLTNKLQHSSCFFPCSTLL